jgi:hypothetical protein
MNQKPDRNELFKHLVEKATLKQKVYRSTIASFRLLKQVIDKFTVDFITYKEKHEKDSSVEFEARMRGDFEIELKFGGDILLFLMHTNVFEFSRGHQVMKTSYVKDDTSRSFCGVINIYNFLADSFKYNRVNDVGYLIGRIFINKEGHYFIEGKRELGFLFNNFGESVFNEETVNTIIEAAIKYTLNFDLLTPPYDQVKEVTVNEMKNTLDAISLKTGKRLGFKFQADNDTPSGG